MTLDAFSELIDQVADLNGIDRDLAADLVSLAGDALDLDESGKVVVTGEDGKEYHLIYPFDE